MRHFDLTPLYRSTVGFDRLFSMLDAKGTEQQGSAYPPYNIERTGESSYRITMAVAGFKEDELTIEAKEHVLTVSGDKHPEGEDREVLYRGIASRAFERRFQIAEYVKVIGASMEHGLLHIDLIREIPEAKKPRKIDITSGDKTEHKQIEGETVAH
ncbi:Small heat shock protein IbpA [Pseudovibrio axinellae]|uniref:Small heat shock protein IbpA n=1 Tax=Pseudovibrio axinellae TaxID=989403 RepID=A0A161V773_9HYPH|nr:Hsp20 family protein [Pseudovibrio axinellae]KZL20761.1 Small heat shock protein IbpA [Pseudovibrio axinellae]SER23435.1 molecular chaperone IbpA [Pseudovibrio axinellae]